VSQYLESVIPDEFTEGGRDPWFDRLTTLSEVEGESRKIVGNQIILDPGSHPASRDLAGMTNCNTVSGGLRLVVEPTPRRGGQDGGISRVVRRALRGDWVGTACDELSRVVEDPVLMG